MTREELIEVIRNGLWRMKFAESEDDAKVEHYKEIWRHEWDADLAKAIRLLAHVEAAGVRLVPSETNEAMSDAFYHALNHGYPDHRKDRQSKNQGWAMQSEFIWQAFLAASPYAPQKDKTE